MKQFFVTSSNNKNKHTKKRADSRLARRQLRAKKRKQITGLVLIFFLVSCALSLFVYHANIAVQFDKKDLDTTNIKVLRKSRPDKKEALDATNSKEKEAHLSIPQKKRIVLIDPGHQARGDSSHEPIGPGSQKTKPKVSSGTKGVSTGVPEHVINIQIALILRQILEKQGIEVFMTREVDEVNISNSQRAIMGNEIGADVVIRLHCDGAPASSTRGYLTLYPGGNKWTDPIEKESLRAAEIIHKEAVKATGAIDRGLSRRSDLSGFNWSTVPTIVAEMGVMTNPEEDKLLSMQEYQEKLATGIAKGIQEYLNSLNK